MPLSKMLSDLLSGRHQSPIVLIEDDQTTTGIHLVVAFLHSLVQRCDQVLLLSYEHPPHFFIKTLPAELQCRVQVMDSLHRWRDTGHVTPLRMLSTLISCIKASGQTLGIIVDAVTTFVQLCEPSTVPMVLRGLADYSERGNKVQQVIALVHRDVHDETNLAVIRSRLNTIIHLQPPSTPKHMLGCAIQHGEPYKRSTESREDFNISDDFKVKDISPVSKTTAMVSTGTDGQVDPAANLTFKLTLRPEEKAAKDQVVLPYTNIASGDGNSTGQIFYVPDDADDFDEEDPDEDLDF